MYILKLTDRQACSVGPGAKSEVYDCLVLGFSGSAQLCWYIQTIGVRPTWLLPGEGRRFLWLLLRTLSLAGRRHGGNCPNATNSLGRPLCPLSTRSRHFSCTACCGGRTRACYHGNRRPAADARHFISIAARAVLVIRLCWRAIRAAPPPRHLSSAAAIWTTHLCQRAAKAAFTSVYIHLSFPSPLFGPP